MIEIAIGVLQTKADPDDPNNALRDWAVAVIQSPANPPKLNDEAAARLGESGVVPSEIDFGDFKLVPDFMLVPRSDTIDELRPRARRLGDDLLPNAPDKTEDLGAPTMQ